MVQQRNLPQPAIKTIMMSGESPTPAPHGDRRFELKDSLIGTPLGGGPQLNSSRSTQDKGVQADGLASESQTFVLKELNTSLLHPNNSLAGGPSGGSNNNTAAQLESIEKADEIVALPSAAPAKLDSKARSDEEIEAAADHTDARPFVEKNPDEDNKDSCLVDCLYYVDQCCECRIL